MVAGLLLAFLEYLIIGLAYTLLSLLILFPVLYAYSRSLIPFRGKQLLEINAEGGTTEIIRYLIPEELWAMIQWDTPLVPGTIRMNGEDVFLCTRTWKIEGTNLIWKVKLAWLHYNQLEYARTKGILEKALEFTSNLARENTELEKLNNMLAILEGKRQTTERIQAISSAYRDDPSVLKSRIEETKERIRKLVEDNADLLYNPEAEKEVTENGK